MLKENKVHVFGDRSQKSVHLTRHRTVVRPGSGIQSRVPLDPVPGLGLLLRLPVDVDLLEPCLERGSRRDDYPDIAVRCGGDENQRVTEGAEIR
jgi:hypothetical protein